MDTETNWQSPSIINRGATMRGAPNSEQTLTVTVRMRVLGGSLQWRLVKLTRAGAVEMLPYYVNYG